MLTAYNKKFFYRSIVRFYSLEERMTLVRHLEAIKGEVFIQDNREFPFPSSENTAGYGILMADFKTQEDRDVFDTYVGADMRLQETPRIKNVRQLPKEVIFVEEPRKHGLLSVFQRAA